MEVLAGSTTPFRLVFLEAGEAAGATLVAPYSPDLNPIELALAKLKSLLRAVAAHTVTALEDTLGKLLDKFTSQYRQAYFRHCGYSAR